MTIGFVGAGAAAWSLAPASLAAGHTVVAVTALHPASARALAAAVPGCRAAATAQGVVDAADLVFLALPDDRIAPVAGAARWRRGQMAVHLSGALTTGVLAAAGAQGAAVASLHPLYPLVRGRAANFRGAFFALDGEDRRLLAVLEGIVAAAGGRCGAVPAERRALYHAAATLLSNATVTVTAAAAASLEAIGVADGLAALLPLLQGAVDNLARGRGAVGAAITGPVGRGDAGVLSAHVGAVAAERPQLLPLFLAVERATLDLAAASGRLSAEAAAELRRRLAPTGGAEPPEGGQGQPCAGPPAPPRRPAHPEPPA